MRLLQRHILFELLRVFVVLATLTTALLMVFGVSTAADDHGLGPAQVIKVLPYFIPAFLPYTIPATMLLTVCLVYGRLAADQEVTAAKAAGINLLSLLLPAFVLSAGLSVVALVLSDQAVPWATKNVQRVATEAVEDIFLDVLRNRHQYSEPGKGITITVMDVRDRALIRPTFRYAPAGRQPTVIQSERAELSFDLENEQVILELDRGHIDLAGGRQMWFEHERRPFPFPQELKAPRAQDMTVCAINTRIAELDREVTARGMKRDLDLAFSLTTGQFGMPDGIDRALWHDNFWAGDLDVEAEKKRRQLETAKHSRFAMAASCLAFVFVGAPYSILQARRHFLTTFVA
ncbi:MAG: LptF/LptG family permease, partial [Planctomycetota bacterium]